MSIILLRLESARRHNGLMLPNCIPSAKIQYPDAIFSSATRPANKFAATRARSLPPQAKIQDKKADNPPEGGFRVFAGAALAAGLN
jgi:hypothetical protein